MIRNTSLPGRVRAQAQLQLSQMHAYTRPTQIKNRCVESGTARSVFRDFRINRVSGLMRLNCIAIASGLEELIADLGISRTIVPIPYAGSGW
jgi:ribosomal protein S14